MDILTAWAAGAPLTIYVYGSRVRGDHRPDSDVDLYAEWLPGWEDVGSDWYNTQREADYPELRKRMP